MKNFLGTLAITLVLALLLSGAHAKDIAASSLPNNHADTVKVLHDDSAAKAYADLHNHVDKQTGKNLSHDSPLADNRSLRTREKSQQDLRKIVSRLIKDWQSNLFVTLA